MRITSESFGLSKTRLKKVIDTNVKLVTDPPADLEPAERVSVQLKATQNVLKAVSQIIDIEKRLSADVSVNPVKSVISGIRIAKGTSSDTQESGARDTPARGRKSGKRVG